MDMDEYTYKFLAATHTIVNGDYSKLLRETESSGNINPMRQSFYKINENAMKVLIPHFFDMHESLFEHVNQVKDGIVRFMTLYGYISGLSLLWVNFALLLLFARAVSREKLSFDLILLDLDESDLVKLNGSCAVFG